MKLGNKFFLYNFFFRFSNLNIFAEDKITSSPLINLRSELKPSFEDIEDIK